MGGMVDICKSEVCAVISGNVLLIAAGLSILLIGVITSHLHTTSVRGQTPMAPTFFSSILVTGSRATAYMMLRTQKADIPLTFSRSSASISLPRAITSSTSKTRPTTNITRRCQTTKTATLRQISTSTIPTPASLKHLHRATGDSPPRTKASASWPLVFCSTFTAMQTIPWYSP